MSETRRRSEREAKRREAEAEEESKMRQLGNFEMERKMR